MSRFSQPPDRIFSALDASIGYDWRLGPYDVEQSRAHAKMLAATGIVSEADRDALLSGLERVERELEDGEFPFEPADVDIHMAIERRLTEIAGPVGGKLHTARSRNDQVATDMALFTRAHTWIGPCRATRICSARSPCTSVTTCSPTSGCSGATLGASSSCWGPPPSSRWAPERWRG